MGLKIVLLFGALALVAGRTVNVQKTSFSLTEESEEADELNDVLRTFLGYPDVTSGEQNGDDLLQGCSKGQCTFCKKVLKLNICFVAKLEKNSIALEVTINNKKIVSTDIKVPNPPAICKKTIPGIPMIKDVCIQITNVNLKEGSGCVSVSFKLEFKKMSVKIACFKIPTIDASSEGLGEETVELEFVDDDDAGTTEEDTGLKFETRIGVFS